MRQNVLEFATSLLDHTRTSHELEVMLNYNPLPGFEVWEPGDRQSLERLKLAISYKQKQVRFTHLDAVRLAIDSIHKHNHFWCWRSNVVCGSSQCPTVAGLAMVRRIARLSSQKYVGPIDSSGPAGLHVSRVQHDLHICTEFGEGKIHEKTVRQIHHSFDQLCDISEFVFA